MSQHIRFWHADLKQEFVRLSLFNHVERWLTARCFQHFVSTNLPQFAKQFPVNGIVFGAMRALVMIVPPILPASVAGQLFQPRR